MIIYKCDVCHKSSNETMNGLSVGLREVYETAQEINYDEISKKQHVCNDCQMKIRKIIFELFEPDTKVSEGE